MDERKIAFIICVNDEEVFSEAVLYLQNIHIPMGMTAEIIPIGGAVSMCAGYEQGRKASTAKYKVYMHQDVLIIRKNFVEEFLQVFRNPQVGIMGLAGCEHLPRSGIWWEGKGVHNMIAHSLRAEHIEVPAGVVPACPVQAADGVLMVTQYDIPWREDLFKGWHFYDASICQEYRRQGYQVVIPRQDKPWLIHQTRHIMAGDDYNQERQIFLQEYKNFC